MSLLSALNDTFDMTTASRFAYTLLLPPELAWLLLGMALISMGALGYQVGLRGTPSHMLAALLTLMWTLAQSWTSSIWRPRESARSTPGAAVYEWTLQGFRAACRSRLLPAPVTGPADR